MRRLSFCYLLTALIVAGNLACAGTGTPTVPGNQPNLSPGLGADNESRELLGVWEMYYDGSSITVTDAAERFLALPHINVKKFLKPPTCSDCLKISNFSNDTVNKILTVDVTIKNPTEFEGADPRGIFMAVIDAIYLKNADDYTTQWNEFNGKINGFKLFGKDLPNGVFMQNDTATETFEIKYNFTPFYLSTAIDAIYPKDSLREPYAIQSQTIDGALDLNGNVGRTVEVDVFDRNNDHGAVSIACDELGIDMALTQDDTDINHFTGVVNNVSKAPEGQYKATILACDSQTEWVLYDYLTIDVTSLVGTWVVTKHTLANSGCPRDMAFGFAMLVGGPSIFSPGGSSCTEISVTDKDFLATTPYFSLLDIDPIIPGFSPHPVTRLDFSVLGGTAFFSDSEEVYSDPFYSGAFSSLLVTLTQDMDGIPIYFNNGDGDASRIPPPNPALRGVNVCDDLPGNLYGLWADPDGVLNPLVYGLAFPYKRHDVQMGGVLPAAIVGETVGRISRFRNNLRAIQIGDFIFETGRMYFLENDGTNSFVEIMQFTIDFTQKTTTWDSLDTIPLGPIDAVDLDVLPANPSYILNPESDTVAVLVTGTSGLYIKMFDTQDFELAETIGSGDLPILPGVGAALEVDKDLGDIYIANDQDEVAVLVWNL